MLPVLIFIATLPVASTPRAWYILKSDAGEISDVKYTFAGVCAAKCSSPMKARADNKMLRFIALLILI